VVVIDGPDPDGRIPATLFRGAHSTPGQLV
jgi:hypothetical protein